MLHIKIFIVKPGGTYNNHWSVSAFSTVLGSC